MQGSTKVYTATMLPGAGRVLCVLVEYYVYVCSLPVVTSKYFQQHSD